MCLWGDKTCTNKIKADRYNTIVFLTNKLYLQFSSLEDTYFMTIVRKEPVQN